MSLFAAFSLTLLSFAPQGQDVPPALLAPAEQKSLHDKLAEYIKSWTEYDEATDKAREKAAKAYNKAKEAFQKEWEGRVAKKGDLMKSPADMQAIFSNCFLYEKKQPLTLRKFDAKAQIGAHFLMVPPSYKSEKPIRTMILVPGQDEAGAWVDGQRYFESTWDKSATAGDSIFHIPVVGKDIDFTAMPDYSKTGAEEAEKQRNGELLGSFGETSRNYNFDRSRVIVDAGKGACSFVLRAATHFPTMFAGLILRHPDAAATADLRLGSLNGMPILLIATAETEAACTKLKERLDAQTKDSCTILKATDAYPFKAATADIEKWLANVKRDVNKKRIVLEPNDDRYKKAHWVAITTMDSIHTSVADKRPRMEVEADRANNRVTVKSVGVESFTLLLNDSLLDLDKEFTVVVNDKAMSRKSARDLNKTIGFVRQRFDGDYVFPVEFSTKVPKPEDKPSDGGAGK